MLTDIARYCRRTADLCNIRFELSDTIYLAKTLNQRPSLA